MSGRVILLKFSMGALPVDPRSLDRINIFLLPLNFLCKQVANLKFFLFLIAYVSFRLNKIPYKENQKHILSIKGHCELKGVKEFLR